MSKYLLYGGFKWSKNVDKFDMLISEKSPRAYFLKVDLEYPDELHHDYPLAHKNLVVSSNMLLKSN